MFPEFIFSCPYSYADFLFLTPVLVKALMGVFDRVGDIYSLICYADSIKRKGEYIMNPWYQRRKNDYESSIKRLDWLKHLKNKGFKRIDKEISFYAIRRDVSLRRMIWYCNNL